jgi:hypothetical protein
MLEWMLLDGNGDLVFWVWYGDRDVLGMQALSDSWWGAFEGSRID